VGTGDVGPALRPRVPATGAAAPAEATPAATVVDPDAEPLGNKRLHGRTLKTIVGPITIQRTAYGAPGQTIPIKDIYVERKWVGYYGGVMAYRRDNSADGDLSQLSPDYSVAWASSLSTVSRTTSRSTSVSAVPAPVFRTMWQALS